MRCTEVATANERMPIIVKCNIGNIITVCPIKIIHLQSDARIIWCDLTAYGGQ